VLRSKTGRADRALVAVGSEAFVALAGAGALAIVVDWWLQTAPAGLGDSATSGGRLAGLLAGYGVVVQLVLRARIPVLERGLGGDTIARWHSSGGVLIVALAIAHVAFVTTGYAATTGLDPYAQLRSLVVDFPYVLLAAVGLVLLVTAVVVCTRVIRSRLPYEVWHAIHLGVYPAIGLVFWHQLANGEQFRHSSMARIAWTTLYVGAAVALIRYRFLAPVLLSRRHRLTVSEVTPEAPGITSVYLSGRHLDRLAVAPGQFFRWRFLTRGMWWAANPYSLSEPAQPHRLRLTVKAAGGHSRSVARLQPGTHVLAEGPCGGFVRQRRGSRSVLLVAAGIGITPIRALFETLPAAPGELVLLYRVSAEPDLVFRAELESIAARRGGRVEYVVGSRATVGEAMWTERLHDLVGDLSAYEVFVCGPPGLATCVATSLRSMGVDRRRMHIESFTF
jgi:ferredoxin-NADP reductase